MADPKVLQQPCQQQQHNAPMNLATFCQSARCDSWAFAQRQQRLLSLHKSYRILIELFAHAYFVNMASYNMSIIIIILNIFIIIFSIFLMIFFHSFLPVMGLNRFGCGMKSLRFQSALFPLVSVSPSTSLSLPLLWAYTSRSIGNLTTRKMV